MMAEVIHTDNLTKRFGTFTAVDHISFDVHKGEVFGFLGANGAGKTTAMRMLCGLSKPTSGTGTVAGFDIARQQEMVKKHIGYMSQKFSLYEDLTVKENLVLFGGIYGMRRKEIATKTDVLLNELNFSSEKNTMVKELPLGWKQKLSFSVSIFHRPGIVFLDEPTGGVDPVARRQFWELIYKASDDGITIFVTTHYMDEAEYCDRVSIMVDGQIKALDSPAALKQSVGAESMDEVFRRLAREAKRDGEYLLAFIQKEFRHILRDRWTLLIIVGMPIAQLLLFGFAITTEVRNASVAVFDPVNDELTTRIIERMNASEYFNVSERITDIDRINDIFREGKTSLVMVFSDNFSNDVLNGEASVQLIADGTDPNQASMITAYAGNILATCQQEIAEKSGMAGAAITPVIRMLYNPQGKSAYNFVPGVMGLILMLICAMMTAVAIVREKETGSMEVLLTSPISPMMIIIAKAIPYLVLSIFDLVLIIVCAVFVMGVPIAGSLFSLALVSILFLICTLCLGLLISTMVETQMAAMIASGMGLMMPTMLLSGLIFPIESMPRILQWISTIVPARWYIQSIKMIMIQGTPLSYTLPEIGVLSLITLILIALSVKNFKTRLT